jgi:type III secretion protein L
MIDLAFDIVRQVIGSFDDAELVARAARRALDTLRDESGIVVHVSPDLMAEIEAHLGRDGTMLPAMRVAGDRHLSGRQCIVTTPAASIDVGIDAQLDAIREVMMASMRNAA